MSIVSSSLYLRARNHVDCPMNDQRRKVTRQTRASLIDTMKEEKRRWCVFVATAERGSTDTECVCMEKVLSFPPFYSRHNKCIFRRNERPIFGRSEISAARKTFQMELCVQRRIKWKIAEEGPRKERARRENVHTRSRYQFRPFLSFSHIAFSHWIRFEVLYLFPKVPPRSISQPPTFFYFSTPRFD